LDIGKSPGCQRLSPPQILPPGKTPGSRPSQTIRSGSNGCGARGTPSPLKSGVELACSRIDEAGAASRIEFPGVRVECPVALRGIELPCFRIHRTAIFGKGWGCRQGCRGRPEHLRLWPLRYRRRRGLKDSRLRLRGKIPWGLAYLGCSPARKKEQRQ
jgi:hypothetical protein